MIHIADILSSAALLYVVSVGLLIVMGVMGVVNLAHGAFLTIGGFVCVVAIGAGLPLWVALVAAPVVGAVIGLVTERVMMRRLYDRPLDTILATWGLAIVITQLISVQFGRGAHLVPVPFGTTPTEILGLEISTYRIGIVVVAGLLHAALVLLTRSTFAGTVARAVIMNPKLARSLGINTGAVNLITFTVGSAIAAFSGALIAPLLSVDPNLGFPWLIAAFMVVLLSGISLGGLVLSAIIIAAGQSLSQFYIAPVVGSIVLVFLPVVVLRFLPGGLGSFSLERFRVASQSSRSPS